MISFVKRHQVCWAGSVVMLMRVRLYVCVCAIYMLTKCLIIYLTNPPHFLVEAFPRLREETIRRPGLVGLVWRAK